MKQYIAKYLPVEGEVKEGYCLDELKNEIVYYNGDYGESPPDHLKKVKLFLCSRDIQAGDKVIDEYGINWDVIESLTATLLRYEISIDEAISRKSFKVIGEISTAATWVKEGDEFDESEVRKLVEIELYYADAEEQLQTYNSFIGVEETYTPRGKQTPTHYETIVNEIIQVKGPCGHFH